MPQRIGEFWTAGHYGKNEVSRVIVLLQSRELSIPRECVSGCLKRLCHTREIGKRCRGMATLVSGQLIKGEVRLLSRIIGEDVRGNH